MATVNDIIDFNNLDNGKVLLDSNPFNLFTIVSNVCGTFKEEATQKALSFHCIIDERLTDVVVRGDELRLSQILFHLIGNAIKFTTVGFVSVNITNIESDEQTLMADFKITDSGIGISKAKQERLLDPFKSKLQRTQRQYQATLGLTIAGQLLKLHDSKLEITSSEGKGSSFNFAILYPLAKIQHILIQPSISLPDTRLDDLRVLCVDDEKLNLLVVKKILAKWNVMTDEAINGKTAVEMCMSKQYDVILMDINMPVMDGFEASKIIKGLKKRGYNPPRIIALTASVGAAKEEVIKFPCIDDCVLKPFKPEELKEKLCQSRVAYSGKMERPQAGSIL